MNDHCTIETLIIGHGLAGLTAAYEITKAGNKVLLLDQETEANIGGQAFWSLEGTFLGGCIFSGMRAGKFIGES